MKLYLTLEHEDGRKVERVMFITEGTTHYDNQYDGVVHSMVDTLKEEELTNEGKRLAQNHD